MKKEAECFGMVVGKEGTKIHMDQIEELKNWSKPTSPTEVRSFVGLSQFFRRFMRDLSVLAAPVTNVDEIVIKFAISELN